MSAFVALAVWAAPQKIGFDKMPKKSQEFVQKYFPNEKIKSVEMDREASWDKYTVYFDSGNQVSFEGGSGDCSQIIMKSGAIPVDVIPSKLRSYMVGKYPNQRITVIETTKDGYRLGIADGTFVDFDKSGDFVKATK